MTTLSWSSRGLTCVALQRRLQEMPAAHRQLVTTLYLDGNELEELPDLLAFLLPNLTQ